MKQIAYEENCDATLKIIFRSLLFLFLISTTLLSWGQRSSVRIWKDVPTMKNHRSKLIIFTPPKEIATQTAVIICPGGSYHHLGLFHEGFKTAKWFNNLGVTAFVLKYRLSRGGYHHPAMIEDLQRSIQWVKLHADEYNIDTSKIGVMGFSAGGHLAVMGGAFQNENFLAPRNINTTVSLKPNFVVAIYPVISMQDSLAHKRSRKSLLTKSYTPEERDKLSLELQIPSNMPPVFLLASKDDDVVNYKNSVVLSKALEKQNNTFKFLLFETGGHGYGLKETHFTKTSKWTLKLQRWLSSLGFL